jgi:hypothetical protein
VFKSTDFIWLRLKENVCMIFLDTVTVFKECNLKEMLQHRTVNTVWFKKSQLINCKCVSINEIYNVIKKWQPIRKSCVCARARACVRVCVCALLSISCNTSVTCDSCLLTTKAWGCLFFKCNTCSVSQTAVGRHKEVKQLLLHEDKTVLFCVTTWSLIYILFMILYMLTCLL